MKKYLIFLIFLISCAQPRPLPAPTVYIPPINAPPVVVTPTASGSANSLPVQVGDTVIITNPDYQRDYVFRIVAISGEGITVETTESGVEIRNNGTALVSFYDPAHSRDTGYELPIGWARFTPDDHTPVVQAYSMKPGVLVQGDQN